VFLYDPTHNGLICFEEPENGIHPARMKMTAELLKDLVSHFEDYETELRQIIVNSHSTVLVSEILRLEHRLYKIWFSELITQITTINNKKHKFQITKMLPVIKGGSQITLEFSENERKMTLSKLVSYLQNAESEDIIDDIEA
jgi:AAA15 family ATPase/GTPase